jgi:NAD-reducing hydrogenase small subunit
MTDKPTIATVWLDGCSGCHMSIFDMDERLLEIAEQAKFVYTPLVDQKTYPDHVDVAIVEGSVSTQDDLDKIKKIRKHTTTIVSLGDCAVAGNIPTLRNPFSVDEMLDAGYVETATANQQHPTENVPVLLPVVRPIHEVVPVDVFVQGCPPSADTIYYVITELLAGRKPDLATRTRPGA